MLCYSSIGQTEMSIGHFKCPFVQWTNGHCLMANTSASYRQGVMLNHITSLYFIALLSDAVKVTCPFDIMKCPLDIQKCLFVHRTNRNVHWIFQMSIRSLDEQKCPVDIQMSIGHIAVVLDMYAK